MIIAVPSDVIGVRDGLCSLLGRWMRACDGVFPWVRACDGALCIIGKMDGGMWRGFARYREDRWGHATGLCALLEDGWGHATGLCALLGRKKLSLGKLLQNLKLLLVNCGLCDYVLFYISYLLCTDLLSTMLILHICYRHCCYLLSATVILYVLSTM